VDEREAIDALVAGDLSGLEVLVNRHEAAGLRLAFAILGERASAEDATDDAFVAVQRAIAGFDTRRPFRPWFLKIVANAARKAARQSTRVWLAGLLPPTPVEPESVEESVIKGLEHERLAAAVATLPAIQRSVLVLHYELDMSEVRITEILSCPVGTVKSSLHAAREQLRRTLADLCR